MYQEIKENSKISELNSWNLYFLQFNAISKVNYFKNIISLNKRFWVKSFFGNLQRSFCRIDLKIKNHIVQYKRLIGLFFMIIFKKLFPVERFKKTGNLIISHYCKGFLALVKNEKISCFKNCFIEKRFPDKTMKKNSIRRMYQTIWVFIFRWILQKQRHNFPKNNFAQKRLFSNM